MALPLSQLPRDLKLGTDNDLVVTTDLVFTTGVEAVAQDCRIALQTIAGEWFLDLDVGIPYWDEIITRKPAYAKFQARVLLREELLAVEGVLEVLKLDVQITSLRTLSVTFQVRTGLGDTPEDSIALSLGGGS